MTFSSVATALTLGFCCKIASSKGCSCREKERGLRMGLRAMPSSPAVPTQPRHSCAGKHRLLGGSPDQKVFLGQIVEDLGKPQGSSGATGPREVNIPADPSTPTCCPTSLSPIHLHAEQSRDAGLRGITDGGQVVASLQGQHHPAPCQCHELPGQVAKTFAWE